MAAWSPGRPLAASLLLLLLPQGACNERGLGDGVALVQVREGAASSVAHAEAAAEMINGVLNMLKGAGAGGMGFIKREEDSGKPAAAAGCSWPRDFKSSWSHMAQFLPTVEHSMLTIMMPKFIENSKLKPEEVQKPSAEEQLEMSKKMQKAMAPLQAEFMHPECNQELIRQKVMTQSLTGGKDAEEITARCLVKAAHVSPACARCSSNFLKDFMGRGMFGLASSCVPSCMPANKACKKGITDQCLNKAYPCMKCMKPGMLAFSDCVGINATRFSLSNKMDLFAKAVRDGSTSGAGLQQFINNVVLAMNA